MSRTPDRPGAARSREARRRAPVAPASTGGPFYLGVDLGGTRLRMAAVAPDGRLASEVFAVATGREFGPQQLERELPALVERVLAALDGRSPLALGFGTAGVVRDGRPLSQSDNLPLLNGVDVGAVVRASVNCPVGLENDARCFTLAEARCGAGRGARDLCGLTLGTGVGCGVMVDGRLVRGAAAQAGEVWKLPRHGAHLEHFLSGAGVVRGFERAGGRPAGLDAEAVAGRARGGDAAACTAWRAFGDEVAFLCETLVAIADPERIVLGGSLSKARDLFQAPLDERLAGQPVRIVTAELGAAAGLIGAAALHFAAERAWAEARVVTSR